MKLETVNPTQLDFSTVSAEEEPAEDATDDEWNIGTLEDDSIGWGFGTW